MGLSNYGKYKRIQDLIPGVVRESSKFNCAICGKEMKCVHTNHLRTHKIDKEQYFRVYGFPNQHYEKKYLIESVIDKIYSLYISQIDKWVYLSHFTKEYVTVTREKEWFRELNRGDISNHLMGKNTVAVLPNKMSSKFLIFDIDQYYSIDDAKEVAHNIKLVLRGFFPDEEIHISYSGNKGIHVELFFSKMVPIKKLGQIFSIILSEIRIGRYEGVNVEMRPEITGINGKAVKLPCGVNHVNKDDRSNYCCFLNSDFEPIENEVDYILDIKKSDERILDEMIDVYGKEYIDYGDKYIGSTLKNSKEKLLDTVDTEIILGNSNYMGNSNNYQHRGIENYLEYGLVEPGTRHIVSFLIGLYLKENGNSKQECEEILLKWSLQQHERELTSSSLHEIKKDINNILKGIFDRNRNYHLSKFKRNVSITQNDLEIFEELNRKGKETGKSVFNLQKVFFAMIVQCKRYAEDEGIFYMTYDQLQDSTFIGSRNTIYRCLNDLSSWDYIEIVSRNEKAQKGKKNVPNVYRIKELADKKNKEVFVLCNNRILCENCFLYMLKCAYNRDLDKVITRGIKRRVIDLDDHKCTLNKPNRNSSNASSVQFDVPNTVNT